MSDQSSPITPPPELRNRWRIEAAPYRDGYISREEWLIDRAAQWGWDERGTNNEAQLQERADQELEACVNWLIESCNPRWAHALREARRPKPPSLKEQALLQLDTLNADLAMHGRGCDLSQIRRALEALPE